MDLAARRMPEGKARGRYRLDRRHMGQQFGCAVGMGSLAGEMGFRDRIVDLMNKRPVVTALSVFGASTILIAEGVYLLSGHSTPARGLLESMVHTLIGW